MTQTPGLTDPRVNTGRLTSILLVDDEQQILETLRRTLRREPYRLITATSADEALAAIALEPVDIIISDIDMPGTNGLELVAKIRKDYPGIVRLLLTGDASLDAALHAINQGEVYRFLTKPWDSDELRKTLREAVERLDELRAASNAAREAGSRDRLRAALERAHPGITRIELVGDAYVVDPAGFTSWLAKVTEPRLRQAFGGADDPEEDSTDTRRLKR